MSPKPEPMEVLAQNIPLAVQKGKVWVGWKWVLKPGGNGKPDEWTKPPYNIQNGHKASSTSPATWTHFNRAVNAYLDGKFDGIGRVIRSPLVGIDLDKCRDRDTGSIEPWAAEIIAKLKSYTEISPSGTGVKVWIEGKIPGKRRRQDKIEFYDGKTVDGKDGGRYFTVTGQHLESTPYNVEKRQKELDELYNELFPEQEMGTNVPTEPKSPRILHGIDDQQIIEKALAAKDGGKFRQLWEGDFSGYPSQSEADQALCNKLAFWVGGDPTRIDSLFRQSGLMREKWNREDYRNRTIDKAISQITETYSPQNNLTLVDRNWIAEVEWPGLIKDYLEYTNKFSESPTEFHLAAIFFTISCIVGRGRFLIQGEHRIYTNKYVVAVAPSSLFKKSAVEGFKTNLSRLELLRSCFLGQIGSPEGLFTGLQRNNGSGVLYYPELGTLLAQSSGRQYMSGVLELLCELYDCPDYHSKILSQGPKEVSNVFLNMMAATQLHSLSNHTKEGDLLTGFLPRCCVVYSENLKEHKVRRPAPDKTLQNKIIKSLNAIRSATGTPATMDLSEKAWEIFEAWGHERFKDARVAPPQLQPMYGRLEAHCFKFAMLLAIARNPKSDTIETGEVNTAIACADFVLDSYRRLVLEELTFTAEDRKLKRVADVVKGKRRASRRDITIATRFRNRDLEEALRTLTVMGKIKKDKGPKGGEGWKWIG